MTSRGLWITIALLALAGMVLAQAPQPAPGPDAQRGAPGTPPARGAQDARGAAGRGAAPAGGGGMGSAEIAELIFEEHWTRGPMTQPMNQSNLGNQDLTFHLYGDQQVRKSMHPTEDYTYSGETKTNWAITVGDPKNYWDLSGSGKMMLRTRNSGYRFTHIVIKTADGKYYASEEGSGVDRPISEAILGWSADGMLGRLRSLFGLVTKSSLANPSPEMFALFGAVPTAGVGVSPEVALRVPAVSAAVRAISEAVACLPLNVCRVLPTARAKRCASIPSTLCFKGSGTIGRAAMTACSPAPPTRSVTTTAR